MKPCLQGIKIVDLSTNFPGPYCTMNLADLGAEVILVENPDKFFQNQPPYYEFEGKKISGISTILNRNKKSIGLNLKQPKALEILYKLVETADIFIESNRPGVAKKLKIDYETLSNINPGIIYVSLTGYGQESPLAKEPGHDINFQSLTGILNQNTPISNDSQNKPLINTSLQVGIFATGFCCSTAILAAYIERNSNKSGQGQYIDLSVADALLSLTPYRSAFAHTKVDPATNMLSMNLPFYRTYKCRDGKFIAVAAAEPKFWANFCRAIDLDELIPKQLMKPQQMLNNGISIEKKILSKTREEWVTIFQQTEQCVTPVLTTEESYRLQQFKTRNMIIPLTLPNGKTISTVGSPFQIPKSFSDKWTSPIEVGQNAKEILREIGYTEDQILEFTSKE